ncbi:hypothetical protein Tco_0568250 [Tanacetum coccineum]
MYRANPGTVGDRVNQSSFEKFFNLLFNNIVDFWIYSSLMLDRRCVVLFHKNLVSTKFGMITECQKVSRRELAMWDFAPFMRADFSSSSNLYSIMTGQLVVALPKNAYSEMGRQFLELLGGEVVIGPSIVEKLKVSVWHGSNKRSNNGLKTGVVMVQGLPEVGRCVLCGQERVFALGPLSPALLASLLRSRNWYHRLVQETKLHRRGVWLSLKNFETTSQFTDVPSSHRGSNCEVFIAAEIGFESNEAKVKHDIDVIETINIELEHKVAKLLKENETLKRHYKEMFDSIKTTRAKNIEHTTSLIANNDKFKAQLQEKGFAIAALKNELRKLTGNSVNTKFAKSSILGKPALQPRRNQSVVRQPTAFKSERPRISKQRFASQVDVNNDLSKPVTTHYLPKERESAVAKPHHMIAPGSSRYSSNDMVHNHYLEEAKKKTQESSRNSEPSVMPSARSQSTANGSKPKPRINNQKSRNWPASKSSCVTTKTVPIAEHSRNSRSFSDSKHFVCSTCQKCVFNANHDSCVTKFLNEVNSRAKVPSNKTTKRYIPVEQTSFAKKPERQIPKRHRSSIKKTSVVHEKTMTPRSCRRWKPTGKLFKTVGLKWIPTGKIFTSSTTKVDSDPTNGSDADITNQYECKQTLDVSAEHLSDTYVLTMKMEILLETTSNKLLVGCSDGVDDDGGGWFVVKRGDGSGGSVLVDDDDVDGSMMGCGVRMVAWCSGDDGGSAAVVT